MQFCPQYFLTLTGELSLLSWGDCLSQSRFCSLLQYFDKRQYYWVSDLEDKSTVGDLVLIKLLPEQRTDVIKHYIKEIVFKVGHTIDPVSGRRCRGWNYVDDTNRTFGALMPESQTDLGASATGSAESNTGSSKASSWFFKATGS